MVACGSWEGGAPSWIPKPCPVVLLGCRVLNKISFILCPILTSYAQADLHSNPLGWLSRTCPLFYCPRGGCWALELGVKSTFERSLLSLAFLLKVLGMVAGRSMGIRGLSLTPFIWASWQTCQRKLQLFAIFGFLIHFTGGEGTCMWMRRDERLSPKQIYRESITSYYSAESHKEKWFCLVHMIKLSTTGMEKAAQEASCCAKGCDIIAALLGLSCSWGKVCNQSFVFH